MIRGRADTRFTRGAGRIVAWAVVLAALVCAPAVAQGPRVRMTRRAPILDTPRGDGVVLGTVDAGQELEVIGRQGNWYHVVTPMGMSRPNGWIAVTSVQLVGVFPAASGAKPRGELMIRGYGQASGGWFNARDSFDTIAGTAFGAAYGGGAQVVFPNGAFVQGGVERYRKTGSRVLVSGSQFYAIDVPDTVTVMPIEGTVGYRDAAFTHAIPYVGAGARWEILKEDSPGLSSTSRGHIGFQIAGGIEVPVAPWLSLAGEVEWSDVPKAIGDSGISTALDERDLGRLAVRFKVLVGH